MTIHQNGNGLDSAENVAGRQSIRRRLRLVANLDALEASTHRFSLKLDSGERVAGSYPGKFSDRLAELCQKRVLVLGTGVFDDTGGLLKVEAESVDDAASTAPLFATSSVMTGNRLDAGRLRKPQDARSGMAAIMGRWPGNETEQEIEEALDQIS
jgi:hypothetical protein